MFDGCEALASVNISQNEELTEVPSLSTLTAMSTLNASETGLTALPSLKELESLTTVNLSKSAVESIDGLEGNESVTTLTLTECEKLTDISVLSSLTALKTVDLSKSTALTDDSIKDAFGTAATDDTDEDLKFDKEKTLTVTLTGCTGVEDFDVFDAYGNMTVNKDEAE